MTATELPARTGPAGGARPDDETDVGTSETPGPEPSRRVAYFSAQVIAAGAILLLLWVLISGYGFDAWVIAILTMNASGAAAYYLGKRAPEMVTHPLGTASGALILSVYMLFYANHPVMLIFPAVATAMVGALSGWISMIVQVVPPAAVLGTLWIPDQGLRLGLANTVLAAGLWLLVGAVAIWMQGQLEESHQALIRSQAAEAERARAEAEEREAAARLVAEELEQRTRLAATLHQEVEAVNAASREAAEESNRIATSVEHLADSIRTANDTSTRTGTTVRDMAGATDQGRSMIAQLGEAGQEIVGIVDTITALSNQTNMLALNATIEAERAGESGKGFAVVADEVKQLAQRTAESAAEIARVIDTVQNRVDASSTAMGTIAEMVTGLESDHAELIDTVSQQARAIDDIAAAASSGAAHMGEIDAAIDRLDGNARSLVPDR